MSRIEPEIVYHHVSKSDGVDRLIREKIAGLDRFCDHIDSCSVAVERPNAYVSAGSGYRVRIALTVAPSHEVVAVREADEGEVGDDLTLVIRQCFDAAKKQLTKLTDKQHREVKASVGTQIHRGHDIA